MCKCEQKTDFKVALRNALAETTESQKMAVWENKENKEVYFGTLDQAKDRLKNGTIECYFIPKKENDKIAFDIVDQELEVYSKEPKINIIGEFPIDNSIDMSVDDSKPTKSKKYNK